MATVACDRCGKTMRSSNLARHLAKRTPCADARGEDALVEMMRNHRIQGHRSNLLSSILAEHDWAPHTMPWLPREQLVVDTPPPKPQIRSVNRAQPNYVYFIRTTKSVKSLSAKSRRVIHVKIGRSVNPSKRLAALQTGCPHRLTLLVTFASADAAGLEARLHRIYAARCVSGEWFEFTQSELDTAINDTWQFAHVAVDGMIA